MKTWQAIGVATVLYVSCYFTAQFFIHPPANSGEWASWVQGFGTVGAFVGTIWLATSQERLRIRNAEDVARLVAGRVSGALELLINRVERFHAVIVFAEGDLLTVDKHLPVSLYLPEVDGASLDVDTLSLLVPIKNRPAHRIAKAIGFLQALSLETSSQNMAIRWRHMTPQQRRARVDGWSSQITIVLELLKTAKADCVAAADIGAPHPSAEEIYGPWAEDDA